MQYTMVEELAHYVHPLKPNDHGTPQISYQHYAVDYGRNNGGGSRNSLHISELAYDLRMTHSGRRGYINRDPQTSHMEYKDISLNWHVSWFSCTV